MQLLASAKSAFHPNSSAISSLLLSLPLGSRFEGRKSVGIAHLVKNSVFLSNAHESKIAIAKESEFRPSMIAAALTRERLMLFANCPPEKVEQVLNSFAAMAANCDLLQHEFTAMKESINYEHDQHQLQPEKVLHDALHHVAFRYGLGNGLFFDPIFWKRVSTGQVEAFKRQNLQNFPSQISLCHDGVEEGKIEELLGSQQFTKRMAFGATKNTEPVALERTAFFGGELRIGAHDEDEFNYFSIAWPSKAGFASEEWANLLVLFELLRNESAVPFATPSFFYHEGIKPFLEVHSDASLLGVVYKLTKQTALLEPIKELLAELKGIPQSSLFVENSIAGAKEHAKFNLVTGNSFDALNFTSKQLFCLGKVLPMQNFYQLIDKVTGDSVRKVFESMLAMKPAVVTRGYLTDIPFFDAVVGGK